MMTFADFETGAMLGRHDFVLDDEAIGLWTGLFPEDRRSLPIMPPAMIAMIVMRAFVQILHDRPRGNVHAGQKF